MKHSAEELFHQAYRYFARGDAPSGTEDGPTAEDRNQQEAHDRASAEYSTWRDMLRRIADRYPEQRFPGVGIENRAVFLQAPGTTPWSRAYKAWLWLPKGPDGSDRRVGFQVSFVVPYYMIYVWRDLPTSESEFSFEPAPDEAPFMEAVRAEIEATYPGHTLMRPEVGMTIVPEIEAFGHGADDKATIFDCLFSDNW